MTQAGLRTGSNGVPAGGHGALPAGPFYPAKMDLSAAIDTALRSAERQKCQGCLADLARRFESEITP